MPSFVDGTKVLYVARFVVTVLPRGTALWLESYCIGVEFAEFVGRYGHTRFRTTIGVYGGVCR